MLQLAIFVIASGVYYHRGCHSYVISDQQNSTDVLEYVLLDKTHSCSRPCIKDSAPMVCRYHFALEWYQTMSKACYFCPHNTEDCKKPHCITADGRKRPVLAVNRQMPGPSIELCLGDEVVVDVENRLLGETTTIHWHGHHQRGTPYMDGVPLVTQCPIQPGSTFQYHFRADNIGTHFWHSHTGMQRADGAFGAFIVRVAEEADPHCNLYDYDLSEHKMIILDWGEEVGLNKFVAHHHSDGDNKPTTILVNGKGRFQRFDSSENNSIVFTPTERYVVEQGYRYRFRVINAGYLNCPIEISIDNHSLTIISTDGNNIEPVTAESFVTYAGERFDFVLNADQPKGLYWVRFRGLMDCDERFKSAHQVAVLQYLGEPEGAYPQGDANYEQSHKEGLQVNALNKGTGHNTSLSVPELRSLNEMDARLMRQPDLKYFVSYDFYKIDNPHYHRPNLYGFHNVTDKKQQLLTPQLNHISMKLQPFALLPGREKITPGMFCNESTVANCEQTYCECTHVVQVPLGSVVEMILIDKGFAFDANHPFHLHGHTFRVVAMERLGKNTTVEEVTRLDEAGMLKRNFINPPEKDTVTVPDGGYTVIRFVASNPGYWLFHCHIEFHVELGMSILFKFGEHREMPPVPANFPACGNYIGESQLPPQPPHATALFSEGWWQHLFTQNSSASKFYNSAKSCAAIVVILLLLR